MPVVGSSTCKVYWAHCDSSAVTITAPHAATASVLAMGLGIENTALSPALTRMVGTVGAMVSFQEGSELLTELAGVAVDAKQVERTAEALGEEIAEDERHCTEPCDVLPLPRTRISAWMEPGSPYARRS